MKIVKKIKFITLSIVLLLALFGLYKIGNYFFVDNIAVAKNEQIKNYRVQISNEDFQEVQEIDFKSGYKRPYNFTYTPEEMEEFLFEDSKNENWMKRVINSGDKWLNEKSLSIDVRSETLLGYDTQYSSIDDFTYDKSNKTLYVKPPHLQMIIMLDYNIQKVEEGIVTKIFDPFELEEFDSFQDDAREKVQKKFLNKEEIDLGYELTNKSFEKSILNKNISNKLSIDIEKVVFEKNTEPVEILNEELLKK